MRRIAVTATAAGIATLVAGWAAVGATAPTQQQEPAQAAPPPIVATPAAGEHAQLPPLPQQARPKVVQPEAGASVTPGETVLPDPGLSANDDAPTREASAAERGRHRAIGGANAVDKAVALPNGVALPPLEAPEAVKQIIEAGNSIARTPYKWGGGHGKWQDTGYDCSGSVSFALAAAGLLSGPLSSGQLMSWGEPGKGKWVTIWTHEGHVFLEVAGIRFDTSAQRSAGSRWTNEMRSTAGFVARHPAGL
jgi:cell wall-associated NlpC family hydrolase